MLYVVVLNTNTCRIYKYQRNPALLKPIRELTHPESKMKARDGLASDRAGHFQSYSLRGAYSPRTDAKEVEIDNFARIVAKELNQERNQRSFDKLIIMAESQMLGRLLQHLNKNVKELIIQNVEKDVVKYNERKIVALLQEYII